MANRILPKYLEVGDRFSELTVIEPDVNHNEKHNKVPAQWKYICRCSCGDTHSVQRGNLLSGHTTKCTKCAKLLGRKKAFKPNPIKDHGDYIEVFFKTKGGSFVVDKEDYDKIKNHTWHYALHNSVETRIDWKLVKIHQLLTNFKYKIVDHIDNDPKNNRRNNLRGGSQGKNCLNRLMQSNDTSGYKGVRNAPVLGSYIAVIGLNDKTYNLGTYTEKEHVAYAYDVASRILHRHWGKTNLELGLIEYKCVSELWRSEIKNRVKGKLRDKGVYILKERSDYDRL